MLKLKTWWIIDIKGQFKTPVIPFCKIFTFQLPLLCIVMHTFMTPYLFFLLSSQNLDFQKWSASTVLSVAYFSQCPNIPSTCFEPVIVQSDVFYIWCFKAAIQFKKGILFNNLWKVWFRVSGKILLGKYLNAFFGVHNNLHKHKQ